MKTSKILLLIFILTLIIGIVTVFVTWLMVNTPTYDFSRYFSVPPNTSFYNVVNVPIVGNRIDISGTSNETAYLFIIYPGMIKYIINGTFHYVYTPTTYYPHMGNITMDISTLPNMGVHGFIKILEYNTFPASTGYPIGVFLIIISFIFLGYSIYFSSLEKHPTTVKREQTKRRNKK